MIHREDMERLVDAKKALGAAGDRQWQDTATYHVGAAIDDVEKVEGELVKAIFDSMLDFIGEHILCDGLPENKHAVLMEWVEDTINERADSLDSVRASLNLAWERLGEVEHDLDEAVANIERESWLASIGAV